MMYSATAPQQPPPEYDAGLLWVTILLLGLGLVMVYSSSIAIAEAARYTGHQASYYLLRHAFFLLISLAAAAFAFQVPLRLWQQSAPYLFLFGSGLLLLVLIPGVGREVNGSQRWLALAVLHLHTSEIL